MRLIERTLHYLCGNGPSWSQFGEDAHIRSYFRSKAWTKDSGYSPIPKGFYVDVGCCHPIRLSNTLWFYKSGWSGINIDPTPGVKQLFDRWRPRDTNLDLAISNDSGNLIFYTEGGKSSVYNTASREQAMSLVASGMIKNLVEVEVKCDTLANVLERHLPTTQRIDFMSVDAEGYDLDVLKSNDWQKFRPEILLVEAHSDGARALLESEMVSFMEAKDYELRAWLRPNLVFKTR